MEGKYTVPLKTIVEEHDLEIVHKASDYEEKLLDTADINRPGLQLTGFYDYFDPNRIQIIGWVETTYLRTLSTEERAKSFDVLMGSGISAFIICHRVTPMPECIEAAKKHNVTVLATDEDTSEFLSQIIATLRLHLAPRTTRHGVLVEVHGEGLLIMGESGVGKSETALELLKRGHRLISDDAVEIKRTSRKTLIGTAPDVIKHYMELRGIGVINVRRVFGISAIKPVERIDLIVNLEAWDTTKYYDRLGIETEHTSILGVKVPCMTIPVKPGRNLAVILELAAINHRQKEMGYNNALELAEQHDRELMRKFESMNENAD